MSNTKVYLEPWTGALGRWLLYSDGLHPVVSELAPNPETLLYWYYGYAKEEWLTKQLTGERRPIRISRGAYTANGRHGRTKSHYVYRPLLRQ